MQALVVFLNREAKKKGASAFAAKCRNRKGQQIDFSNFRGIKIG